MSKKKSTKKPVQDKTVWDKKIRQLGLRTRGAAQSWIVEMRDDDGKRLRRTPGRLTNCLAVVVRARSRGEDSCTDLYPRLQFRVHSRPKFGVDRQYYQNSELYDTAVH
jgi:hypothetical protein